VTGGGIGGVTDLAFVEPSKRFADRIVPECGQNRVALELLPGSMRERNMRERI
jgi:hypothetical protein